MPNPLNTLSPRGDNNARRPNWPAGNLNNANRREVVFGTGKFGPPSITVHAADATGNVAPVRHIVGPKAQLNWPTGISIDSGARRDLRLERRRRLHQRLQRHGHRRRRTDSADQGTEDAAPQPQRRVGGHGQRRGVGRELRQPHRDRLQVGRQRQRRTDPRDPQRAAQRTDHAHQQSLHDCVRHAARRSARAELRGPAAHRGLLVGGRQERRAEPDHRRTEHEAEPHGARDCLRRDPRRDRRAVEHRAGGA